MLGVIAFVGGGFWYAETIANYSRADAECIKFAEESDAHIAFDPDPEDSKIFVANKWIKGTDVVVELGQSTAKKKGYYQSRLCVLGHSHIMIPSKFEEWQYR
jgi:hypothetical protein